VCQFSARGVRRGQGEGVGGFLGQGLADGCLVVWVPFSAPPSPNPLGLLPLAANGGWVPCSPPRPCSPSASCTPHRPHFLGGKPGVGGTTRVCLHPKDPKSPPPSPCPGLCQPLPAALPRACRVSVRISLSFLPRAKQLIIYPIIKEETVNEMKTSQKHLLGLLSSPPRAACAGSGGGRGPGGAGGAAAAGGCPLHPAFLAAAPSSSRTPRPPQPGTFSLLYHQSLAET